MNPSASNETSFDNAPPARWVSLAQYCASGYEAGRPALVRALWYFVSLLVFESGWFPIYSLKRRVLRWFGARVGSGVVIKPHVRIKYPWNLVVGNNSWIGEDAWIDNLARVELGDDVCVSQGAYLCTGSHDHRRVTFDLIVRPIVIGSEAWVAARAVVLGGVNVGRGAVIAAGAIAVRDVPSGMITAGPAAAQMRERESAPADFGPGAAQQPTKASLDPTDILD